MILVVPLCRFQLVHYIVHLLFAENFALFLIEMVSVVIELFLRNLYLVHDIFVACCETSVFRFSSDLIYTYFTGTRYSDALRR